MVLAVHPRHPSVGCTDVGETGVRASEPACSTPEEGEFGLIAAAVAAASAAGGPC